jgi:hypothetical protein
MLLAVFKLLDECAILDEFNGVILNTNRWPSPWPSINRLNELVPGPRLDFAIYQSFK